MRSCRETKYPYCQASMKVMLLWGLILIIDCFLYQVNYSFGTGFFGINLFAPAWKSRCEITITPEKLPQHRSFYDGALPSNTNASYSLTISRLVATLFKKHFRNSFLLPAPPVLRLCNSAAPHRWCWQCMSCALRAKFQLNFSTL